LPPESVARGPRADLIPLWRERDFVVYSLGNAISFMGTWAQRIGIGWLSWELTQSSTWVGCIALAQYVPLIILGPFFGVLLDRHDRRGYALAVNGCAALLALALYALTALHWMTINLLLVLAILLGIVNSAYQAARLAMVNDVVRPELLAQGIAINSILFNLTRALGPAVAGVLIAHQGIAAAFAANAVSFLAILGALSIIDLRKSTVRVARKGMLLESREGFAYASAHPRLRRLLILAAITSVLGRGGLELLPAFAAAVFNRGSTALAELNTAVGIGAIAGALLLSRSGTGPLLGQLTRYATLALGIILAIFGLTTHYTAALVIMTVFGLSVVLCSVGLQTLLQSALEDRYRGRVLGLWSAVNVAGPGVGAAILGALAQPAGLMAVTVSSGLLCSILVFSVIGRSRLPFE
jgi:predicted MFS family arabinose efflux permease